MTTKNKTPTPARLSAISTSLLTSILEITQQNSLEITPNSSTKSNIVKNLLALRDGLVKLGTNDQDEILLGLRKQYERIVGLVKGVDEMEEEIKDLDFELPSPPLIDVGDNSSSAPELIPGKSTTSQFSEVFEPASTSSHPVELEMPKGLRSRHTIEEDETLIRSQNEQVKLMQRALIDDQDRTLDQLSDAISRQRDLSLHISSELEVQENLLDELDHNMDFTSNRLTRANRRMDDVFRKIAKDGACWTIFGLVALLLFLIVLLK
ncbi:hypothetical protein O181_038367 [Austropuccinia psidii MF-1]|uniref:t-SNARE coiled-coil homology domain-containing protein n=1 Tax=Austropuccinia psidii MF-1 TaxID=1389203 RepID=A0A9Q3DAT1_9BASI|nr:hypothetical protein [Austropuccinia psidii MF-1]